jgi:hypothetical protein
MIVVFRAVCALLSGLVFLAFYLGYIGVFP